jgi:hypothetical protein
MGQGENRPKVQKIEKKKKKKDKENLKNLRLKPLVRSSRGSRWSRVVLVRRRGGVDPVVDLLAYEVDAEGRRSGRQRAGGLLRVRDLGGDGLLRVRPCGLAWLQTLNCVRDFELLG